MSCMGCECLTALALCHSCDHPRQLFGCDDGSVCLMVAMVVSGFILVCIDYDKNMLNEVDRHGLRYLRHYYIIL